MHPEDAWKILGLRPDASRNEIKKAYRRKINEVHPDVTGDDGAMLKEVQEAFSVIQQLANPNEWDAAGYADGIASWAFSLLQGVQWTEECTSFAAFLEKADCKSLAVGEYNEKSGTRPWAAAWGKYTQEEANAEALRVCRQNGARCRLIYVGSGKDRVSWSGKFSGGVHPTSGGDEKKWWENTVGNRGDVPGFGWMPNIDPVKEKLIGYKTVDAGALFKNRVRVPVFQPKVGGRAYYYSPARPRERIHLADTNFKRALKPGSKRAWFAEERRIRQEVKKHGDPLEDWRGL